MDPPPAEFLFLSQEDVLNCGGLDFPVIIDLVGKAYALLEHGQAVNPIGGQIDFGEGSGRSFISVHLGWLGSDENAAGVKIVSRFPRNPFDRHLPSVIALIVLVDPDTGLPRAALDGTLITAARTGATTAVGAKYLARKDSEILAVLGAGVMGKTQVLALKEVLSKLQRVRIFDTIESRSASFARDVNQRTGLDVEVVSSPYEAVTGADVVAPATTVSLSDSYIDENWIKPGAYLSNVSSNDYTFDAVLKADRIVVDGPRQFEARVTVGEMKRRGLLDGRRISTMGQIVAGVEPGRQNDTEICFFSAMGLGVHDVICAKHILEVAISRHHGQRLRLWEVPSLV